MESVTPAGSEVPPRLLSVIVPTRHRPELLSRCLDLLAPNSQANLALVSVNEGLRSDEKDLGPVTLARYEVIVTDDGTDHSTERLIEARYPWARWIAGPRRGPAANRNNGARAARGDWLVFTDDDCLPSVQWLSAFAEAISCGARVLEGRTTTDSENGGPFRSAPVNETGGKLWSCNFAIRKDVFDAIGGFDDRFPFAHLEDVDFRLRISDRVEAIQFVPAALVFHPLREISAPLHYARAHESYFYLAAKRKMPLHEAGLGFLAFARYRLNIFRTARSFGEGLRYIARTAIEVALLASLLPAWYFQYLAFNRPAGRPKTPSSTP